MQVPEFVSVLIPLTTLCLGMTWFMLECKSLSEQQDAFENTSYPTLSDTSTLVSQHSISSNVSTIVGPDGISDFKRVHYWHGISPDPPELLYHSDLKSNPFLIPSPGTSWFALPVKTAHGVFNTELNPVWHIVAPLIIDLFKKCGIKYSSLMTVHFTTEHEDGKKTLGPIVIWIATHPGTTTTQNVHDLSPDILHILHQENRITCGTRLLIQTTPCHTPTNNGGDIIHLVATNVPQSFVVPRIYHNFIMGPQIHILNHLFTAP